MENIKIINNTGKNVLVNTRYKNYRLLTHTFAALSDNSENPLFCASVANNSFSIDLWRGCPLNCAYCHVQGCYEDLQNWSNCYPPKRRSRFSEDEVAHALMAYTWFFRDKSVVSICTSSTEPFIGSDVIESTLKVMEAFVNQGYKNPFWIVTKAGFPSINYESRFRNIISAGNPILMSICWSNSPAEIENRTINRFRNIDRAKKLGIRVNWYLRPICDEWNASEESLSFAFSKVSRYRDYLDNIVPGGLRWTEGVEFGIQVVHGLPMPNLEKRNNVKTLSGETIQRILRLGEIYFPGMPVFFKSSCAISHMLDIANFNFVDRFDGSYCHMSFCPTKQMRLCQTRDIDITEETRNKARKLGYSIVTDKKGFALKRLRETTYQEDEIIKKMISFI